MVGEQCGKNLMCIPHLLPSAKSHQHYKQLFSFFRFLVVCKLILFKVQLRINQSKEQPCWGIIIFHGCSTPWLVLRTLDRMKALSSGILSLKPHLTCQMLPLLLISHQQQCCDKRTKQLPCLLQPGLPPQQISLSLKGSTRHQVIAWCSSIEAV